MTKLYCDHIPNCQHKLKEKVLNEVDSHIINAYVDDLAVGTYASQLDAELNSPILIHPPNYDKLSVKEQSAHINIANWCTILPILDFCSIYIKKTSSTCPDIEKTLSVDVKLSDHQAKHFANRPNQANLSREIQSMRNSNDRASYVNNSPNAFPT